MKITPKSWAFDRIIQSFNLLIKNKNNFIKIIFPLFLYNTFFTIIIWNFISYMLLWNLDISKTDVLISPYYLIIFFIIIIWFLLYITFLVWFVIATIKMIKKIYDDKEIDITNDIKYWLNSIISSFNTYWYIFAYTTIIPFVFIVFWWILYLIWHYFKIWNIWTYWIFIIWFWFLLLLLFIAYRWVKSKFSIFRAIDNDSYNKKSFEESIILTNNNWLRIVWNFLLLSIILWIIFTIIWTITSSFSTWIWDIIDYEKIITLYFNNSFSISDIDIIKNNIIKFYNTFYINNFIVSIIDSFFNSIEEILVLIFTFIFYKRLEIELNNEKNK